MLYPLNLELRGRRCTVIGGGRVAERKIGALLAAGAVVTAASIPELAERARANLAREGVGNVRIETADGVWLDKADPFALCTEHPPLTASRLWDLAYDWQDADWMAQRGARLVSPSSACRASWLWQKIAERVGSTPPAMN